MAKKRGAGEGTVFQDKHGVWWAQLDADEHGKRPKRRAKTQREALAKLRQMQREREQGVDLTAKQPTLAAWVETWLEQVVKPTTRDSTHYIYGYLLRTYIVPEVGEQRLAKLTPALLQATINGLSPRLNATSIGSVGRRLKQCLGVAVEWGYLAHNPAQRLRLPRLELSEEERAAQAPWSLQEARLFLAACAEHPLVALFWVAVVLGTRRGETCGLRWSDLDREARTLTISQQARLVNSRIVLGAAPKTPTSRRTLPVPAALLEALIGAHWQRQQAQRVAKGLEWKEHGLIFTNAHGGPLAASELHHQFKALCAAAGVRVIRPHDQRHTCATLLGEQGERQEVIAALLGHAATTQTAHYTHATMGAMRAAVEGLAHRLSEPESNAQQA